MESHIVKQAAAPARVTHQSLERGMNILESVAAIGGLTSLAEIARRTGLHRSTAHHLLQTLVSLDYLRQDPSTRGYELGSKLFQITGQTWTPEQLGVIAEPLIAELAAHTGEGASVAVYRDGIVRIVAKREADGPVRVVQNIGAHRPIHATAIAKAIVAFLPPPELTALVAKITFERFTPRTIMKRTELEAELRRIRTSGFAIDDEEHVEGIRCIAAPVFAYNGQVMASICTVGAKSRMTRQKLNDLRVPMQEFARTLSERLGWSQSGSVKRPA